MKTLIYNTSTKVFSEKEQEAYVVIGIVTWYVNGSKAKYVSEDHIMATGKRDAINYMKEQTLGDEKYTHVKAFKENDPAYKEYKAELKKELNK